MYTLRANSIQRNETIDVAASYGRRTRENTAAILSIPIHYRKDLINFPFPCGGTKNKLNMIPTI